LASQYRDSTPSPKLNIKYRASDVPSSSKTSAPDPSRPPATPACYPTHTAPQRSTRTAPPACLFALRDDQGPIGALGVVRRMPRRPRASWGTRSRSGCIRASITAKSVALSVKNAMGCKSSRRRWLERRTSRPSRPTSSTSLTDDRTNNSRHEGLAICSKFCHHQSLMNELAISARQEGCSRVSTSSRQLTVRPSGFCSY
jgi:hypothetical protein